ncbi:MAG TPA: GNAT family N-acetyltransferase [Candidatus Paenibacillus intestinavium]|nr:GNAT family N-acetyltransferase [Candidatus Paenibacillus intestinavium]
MNNQYKTLIRIPSIQEYKNICTAVGWKDFMNFEVAEESLNKSLFGVVIQYEDEIVGMGRVIGDGYIYFYIQDIAVIPAHQNKGIGKLIMTTVTEFLKVNAPEKSFIGMFASHGKESFYKKYGFNEHEGMTGIFAVLNKGEIK